MKHLVAMLAVLLAASVQADVSAQGEAPAVVGQDEPSAPSPATLSHVPEADPPTRTNPAPAALPGVKSGKTAAPPQVIRPLGKGATIDARLLALLFAAGPQGNLALSPLSLEQTGVLLLAGAEGGAQRELLRAFGGSATSVDAALAAARSRLDTLQNDQTAELRIANGVWSPAVSPVKEDYLKRVDASLGAQAQSLDFAQPQALETINEWFRQGTGGLIPKLLDRLSPDAGVVLGNALYFKGRWERPFDPQHTKPVTFHAPAGDVLRALMHRDFDTLAYRETPDAQAVRLSFAGGQYEMLVLLPAVGKTPQALLGKKGIALAPWLDAASYIDQPVSLALPKLELEAGAELQDPLRLEGLAMALGKTPDYRALSSAPLRIDRIVQKVVLKVDEAGAEAAAATAAMGVRSAVIQPERRKVVVDRPYLMMLRHRGANAVLVTAIVQDPGEAR